MNKSIKTYLKTAAKDYSSRSVNPPVVRASTILFKTMQELRKHQKEIAKGREVQHWDYGRQGTQTTIQLQRMLRGLEEAYQVFLTPTGFAAVSLAIMSICRPGDELVISDGVYRPTQKLADDLLKEFNVKTIWYNPSNFEDLEKKITKRTKLIYVENPGSNTFEMNDLGKIVSLAKSKNIFTAIDNTWATAYFFKPLKLGFDISITSATKYYSGHSDVMGGTLAVNKRAFKYVERANKIVEDAYGNTKTKAQKNKIAKLIKADVEMFMEVEADTGANISVARADTIQYLYWIKLKPATFTSADKMARQNRVW